MKEKNNLLKKIQMCDFCLTDVGLYLDSHPTCKNALEYFKKYNDMRKVAYEEYTQKYGPLKMTDMNNTEQWNWVNDPWPWERSE